MSNDDEQMRRDVTLMDLVFVGFNRYVVGLHRDDGTLIWKWKCPDSSGFPAVLLDGDRLIISVQGYSIVLIRSPGSSCGIIP
jgi:hypothetical protein